MAGDAGRPFATGELENGGGEVDEVARVVAEFAASCKPVRPMNDEWGGDTALVDPGFLQAQGGVGGR